MIRSRVTRVLALLALAAALAPALAACQSEPALSSCPQGQVKVGSVLGAAECDAGQP